MFVSDWRQIGDFPRVPWKQIKLTTTPEILLKVALKTTTNPTK
jgi:hypothetical protein